jgi:hypothetical protein
MVLVISTFKVKNGMEAAVRQAFLDRPYLVATGLFSGERGGTRAAAGRLELNRSLSYGYGP